MGCDNEVSVSEQKGATIFWLRERRARERERERNAEGLQFVFVVE